MLGYHRRLLAARDWSHSYWRPVTGVRGRPVTALQSRASRHACHVVMHARFTFPLLQTCALCISVGRTRQASTGFMAYVKEEGPPLLPAKRPCYQTLAPSLASHSDQIASSTSS